MIRRPPRSTLDRSSAASDVYKRQRPVPGPPGARPASGGDGSRFEERRERAADLRFVRSSVSYTHLRAHETVLDLVCRLLLEKKNISTKGDTLDENKS